MKYTRHLESVWKFSISIVAHENNGKPTTELQDRFLLNQAPIYSAAAHNDRFPHRKQFFMALLILSPSHAMAQKNFTITQGVPE